MPAVTVTVNPADLAALRQKLETLSPPALEHILASAAPYLRDTASADAPVLTGALSGSLMSDTSGLQAKVYSPLQYAMAQEFGRHVGGRGGRGMRGRFFLRRAIRMLIDSELPRLFRRAIAELETGWARR